MDEHKISLEELYKRVESSPEGLSEQEASLRLKKYGKNVLITKKRFRLLYKFLNQFKNFFSILLIIGAILAFLAEYLAPGQGNLYIGIAIISVVMINAAFSFWQEYNTERIVEGFKKMLPLYADVFRDEKLKHIPAEELVPGDILYLSQGDKIPADGRLIEEHVMKVDHSSITGESEPQLRKLECTHENILESRNMVFSGTLVQSGNGKALVYGTGMNTQIGKIVSLTNEAGDVETPLYKELNSTIRKISIFAVTIGFLFFIIGLLIGRTLISNIIFAIGIIVALVCEGLLPTVTLTLSIASGRMAKKNALIKNLESVETLGSTTVICTDKTGTLTENNMTVKTVYLNLKEVTARHTNFPEIQNFQTLLKTMTLCNNARIEEDKISGDPSETTLLKFANNISDIKQIIANEKRCNEYPFDSKTKRMITVNKTNEKYVAYLKGAPEIVIEKCISLLVDKKIVKLTKKMKELIAEDYHELASRGEHVLAFACKNTKSANISEDEFTFVGLIGMLDPPRKEVPDAIKKCKTAGIRVIMVTGDHRSTAESIARQIGLVDSGKANIMMGDELERINDEKLTQFLKKDNLIFARTNPAQKLRIVKALQATGEIVTVTGDGVNDAPALKNADMGVAMGLSGTEVAREASDMVLMDDNFATIVNAIEEGRTVFDNIKKFLAYVLTHNIPELIPFIAFVLFNIPLALSVILVLCIDLGTDIGPALGLGYEKPESDVMLQKPKSRKERLLTPSLFFQSYAIFGIIEVIAAFFVYFYVLFSGGWTWGQQLAYNNPLYLKAVTAYFVTVVMMQIADAFVCRTRRESIFTVGIFSNKFVLVGILIEIILISFMMYLPLANIIFGTRPLGIIELLLSVPFGIFIIALAEVRKYLLRRDNAFVKKYLAW